MEWLVQINLSTTTNYEVAKIYGETYISYTLRKKQTIKTKPKVAQILDLENESLKAVTINMLRELKE